MITQAGTGGNVVRAVLGDLECRDDVRSELVHDIARIGEIARDVACRKTGAVVRLLTAEEVERKPGRDDERNLCPSAIGTHGQHGAIVQDHKSLPQRAESSGIVAVEERSCEFHGCRGTREPVDGCQMSGHGRTRHMAGAQADARRNFEAPLFRTLKELDPALPGRPRLFERVRESRRAIRRIRFRCFVNPRLHAHARIVREAEQN